MPISKHYPYYCIYEISWKLNGSTNILEIENWLYANSFFLQSIIVEKNKMRQQGIHEDWVTISKKFDGEQKTPSSNEWSTMMQ